MLIDEYLAPFRWYGHFLYKLVFLGSKGSLPRNMIFFKRTFVYFFIKMQRINWFLPVPKIFDTQNEMKYEQPLL